MQRLRYIIFLLTGCLLAITPLAARSFIHPGCTYTEADILRMRAFIEAKREPYYTTFLALQSGKYASLTADVTQRGESLVSNYNVTIGVDGRRALDLALLYRLTDDTRYADKAVEYLNANSYYTNCYSATAALDLGKITLLIEAAELLRDYAGWTKQDQDRFRAMLVYPGYNTRAEPVGSKTFYWNIYQGDRARWGNQGLFGLRALLAMGIYLDNDTIYNRAYRYLLGYSHLSCDLPYPAGPPTQGKKIAWNGKHDSSSDEYMTVYQSTDNYGNIPDYGYDEQLQYYIFDNGQCSESARDQSHTMFGLFEYVCLAEMAWNQGDDLYGALNSRILKGLEYTFQYNLSPLISHLSPREGVSEGSFYQYTTRSKRWQMLKIYDLDRGDCYTNGGSREAALAHYAVRALKDSADYLWLQRYRDYMMTHYGYESHGKHGLNEQGQLATDNWYYEFPGWGTLTKRREPLMTGDPVTFASGEAVYHLPDATQGWLAADFDTYHYGKLGEGYTYHNIVPSNNIGALTYRPDATADITLRDGHYVLDSLYAGEWYNYTVFIPDSDSYRLELTTLGSGSVAYSVSGLTTQTGPATLRLHIDSVRGDIAIHTLRLVKDSLPSCLTSPAEGNAKGTSTVKQMKDGHLIIIRDGVPYNAQGVRF